ncbi:TOBE domain-containing protein, partial [Enterovibrio norvegicus]
GKGRLTCTVAESEYLGEETHVLLEHPAAKGLVVKMPGYTSLVEGSIVDITFEDSTLHYFDDKGNRMS